MAATVISMAEALADSEELLTYFEAGTLVANETEALRDGFNVGNFSVQFLPAPKPPTPPAPAPNPPVPSPVLASLNSNQRANAIATVKKLNDLCSTSVKPGQAGSMLTVALASLFAIIKPYIAAWLAGLLNPTPVIPPAPVTPPATK